MENCAKLSCLVTDVAGALEQGKQQDLENKQEGLKRLQQAEDPKSSTAVDRMASSR